MIDTREIILKLKAVRRERNLSLNDILNMTNGMVSRSSIQRIFSDGSENSSFRYDDTIRPLVKALLDMDTIEESDDSDTKALKSLLKLKIQRIEELENLLNEEKIKSHEKLEKERTQYERHIKLLEEQIAKKDKRMDEQAERFDRKDEECRELVNRLLSCHCCDKGANK